MRMTVQEKHTETVIGRDREIERDTERKGKRQTDIQRERKKEERNAERLRLAVWQRGKERLERDKER